MLDYLPFTSKDRHEKFIREKFEELIFKPAELEEEIQRVVNGYLIELRSIENKMLVELRADVADFPTTYPNAGDEKRWQQIYHQAMEQAAKATGADLRDEIIREVGSDILAWVVLEVLKRLGTSAAIIGVGVPSGWPTVVISLLIGLVVDYVWDWLFDPVGKLAAEMDRKLDEIHKLIATELRDRLQKFAEERSKIRREIVLKHLLQSKGGTK